MDRELDSHVRLRTEELVSAGWASQDAEAEARRLLGDRPGIARACVDIVRSHRRAERRARIVDALLQDLRYGARAVLRSPGFAIVAIVTLALGIGANTAIFSVVQGVLLEPLPFAEPEELVVVWEDRQQGGVMHVAWANFVDWKRENTSFEGIFAYETGSTTVLGGDVPTTARVAVTTVDLWSVLGAVPIEGRLTSESDHSLGAEPTAVVSRSFWQNQLGGRRLDQLILELNGGRARVVGVVGDEFDFPVGTQVWQPLELAPQSEERSSHNWLVAGRLGEGVPIDRADGEIDELTKRLVQGEGGDYGEFLAAGATVRPLHDQMVGEARPPLMMLLGAAGLVLLVACTNLASTLLARGTHRARELAVRVSLGAGRLRLVRQLVTESVVLAAAGAIAGVALGAVLVGVLQRMGPASIPRLDEVGIDGTVLAYTACVAVLTVLLFGLFPALRVSSGEAGSVLRSGSRGNAQRGKRRAWSVLVGTEVALALVLLVGSGLLIRSFQAILSEETGVDPSDVMTTSVILSNLKYDTPDAHARWYTRLVDELRGLPGVSAAGVISSLPVSGFLPNGRVELDGDLEKHAVTAYVVTSAGALEALDVPLLRGRSFGPQDTPDQPHVAIVSESFARQYWPDVSAIGRLVTGGGMDNFYEDRAFAEVVGVVGDVRYRTLADPAGPTVYFPYTQRPFRIQFGANVLVEASTGDPASVGPGLRAAIQRMDPDVPIVLEVQENLIGASLAAREFTMLLMTGFSLIALMLAVVGIYGVVSYTVARRTREMGIRLALGADPRAVLRMIMAAGLRMVAWGLVLGMAGALLAGRVMQGLLYGIGPIDPLAMVGAMLLLAGAATAATWLPARGGTRVDPIVTMRAE